MDLIEKYREQEKQIDAKLKNISEPHTSTDIFCEIPPKESLDNILKKLKTFDDKSRKELIREIGNLNLINPLGNQYSHVISEERRKELIESFKRKKEEVRVMKESAEILSFLSTDALSTLTFDDVKDDAKQDSVALTKSQKKRLRKKRKAEKVETAENSASASVSEEETSK